MKQVILAVLLLRAFVTYSQEDIDWSQAYSTKSHKDDEDDSRIPPGWNNPHNPHNNGDINVPFDGGVVYLLAGAFVYAFFKARRNKKDQQRYEWIN